MWYHIFCDNGINFNDIEYQSNIDYYKLLPLISLMSVKPDSDHLTLLILSKKKFDDNGWKYYLKKVNGQYVCRTRLCSLFNSTNSFGYGILYIAAYAFNHELINIILKSGYKLDKENIKVNPTCGFILGLDRELSRHVVSYTVSRLTTNIRADIEKTYNILKHDFGGYFDYKWFKSDDETISSNKYIQAMNINRKLVKLGVNLD